MIYPIFCLQEVISFLKDQFVTEKCLSVPQARFYILHSTFYIAYIWFFAYLFTPEASRIWHLWYVIISVHDFIKDHRQCWAWLLVVWNNVWSLKTVNQINELFFLIF